MTSTWLSRDGLIGEAVIEAARRVEWQVVRALQSRPAIGTPDEFLRKPEPQLGMRLEVGQARDIRVTRIVGAHRQRIGIVEAQRNTDRQPHWRQFGVEFGQRGNAVELEDFLGDRAGVFGVDVDAAGRERVQHDCRIAQALAVRRTRLAGRLRGLRQDLAQDVRLRETLGAHIQRRRRERNRSAREHDESDNGAHARDYWHESALAAAKVCASQITFSYQDFARSHNSALVSSGRLLCMLRRAAQHDSAAECDASNITAAPRSIVWRRRCSARAARSCWTQGR